MLTNEIVLKVFSDYLARDDDFVGGHSILALERFVDKC